MDEDLLRNLPEEYAALADRHTVMREVAAQLGDLHRAVTDLGDALEHANMPGRDWRSPDARLRMLPGPLPNITLDAFITRLAEFAAGKGPAWLHGDRRDLEAFHQEVSAIYAVVQRLQRAVMDLQDQPMGIRGGTRLARAVTTRDFVAALERIETILGDFEALRSFMAPLTRQEWVGLAEESPDSGRSYRSYRSEQLGAAVTAAREGRLETMPPSQSKSHMRLRDFAPPKPGLQGQVERIAGLILGQLRRIPPPARWTRRQKEIVATAVVLVLALVSIGFEITHSQPPASGASSLEDKSGRTSATGTVAVPEGTATDTAVPRPTVPPPKVALSCQTQGTTAKLTIQNVGTSAITWQAQASSQLRLATSRGSLAAGQTTTVQVSSSNGRRQATGSVAVTATSNGRSATYSVTCA